MPNIDPKLLDLAKCRGLDWIATGGGCDFIGFYFESQDGDDDGRSVFLVDEYGESPDRESAVFSVCITLNEDGNECIEVAFDHLLDAIDCMVRIRLHGLKIWGG